MPLLFGHLAKPFLILPQAASKAFDTLLENQSGAQIKWTEFPIRPISPKQREKKLFWSLSLSWRTNSIKRLLASIDLCCSVGLEANRVKG